MNNDKKYRQLIKIHTKNLKLKHIIFEVEN